MTFMDRIKEELEMNRRNFLHCSVLLALSTTLGNFFSFAHASPLSPLSTKGKALLERVQIIDAHAHPDRYVISSRQADTSSSLRAIRELGMVASCFAAVGDSVFLGRGRQPGTEYGSTKTQLEEIAKRKMPDLNAESLEAAKKIIEGTAKSMGITVE